MEWHDIPTPSKEYLRASVIRYLCVCGPGELSSVSVDTKKDLSFKLQKRRAEKKRKKKLQKIEKKKQNQSNQTNQTKGTKAIQGIQGIQGTAAIQHKKKRPMENVSIVQWYTSEVHLLDRYPRQDYPDDPLVDKIEWFCYPTGRGERHANGSTVVDISIPPPPFKLVPLSSPRSPLSKTPKQVFFNPIKYI